jgi:hypothetical protein
LASFNSSVPYWVRGNVRREVSGISGSSTHRRDASCDARRPRVLGLSTVTQRETYAESDTIFGWAFRPAAGELCAGCATTMQSGYRLRRLTNLGWQDVPGTQWCLRCWSAHSTLDHPSGPSSRGLGMVPAREP